MFTALVSGFIGLIGAAIGGAMAVWGSWRVHEDALKKGHQQQQIDAMTDFLGHLCRAETSWKQVVWSRETVLEEWEERPSSFDSASDVNKAMVAAHRQYVDELQMAITTLAFLITDKELVGSVSILNDAVQDYAVRVAEMSLASWGPDSFDKAQSDEEAATVRTGIRQHIEHLLTSPLDDQLLKPKADLIAKAQARFILRGSPAEGD